MAKEIFLFEFYFHVFYLIKICFETLTLKRDLVSKNENLRSLHKLTQPGKVEKFRPIPEPIRLQDSQNSARSRIEEKIK